MMILIVLISLPSICHNLYGGEQNPQSTQHWFFSELFQTLSEQQKEKRSYAQLKFSCISFEQTIETYSFVKENMELFRLSYLIQEGGCGHDILPVGFLIYDNQIYKFGKQKTSQRAWLFQQFLKTKSKNISLPNVYFYLHLQDQMQAQSVKLETHSTCLKIPLIMFNKDCFNDFQRTRFIIPDPYISLYGWDVFLKELEIFVKEIKWQDKMNKLYFRGKPSAHIATPNRIFMKEINQNTSEVQIYKNFPRGAFVLLAIQYPQLVYAMFTSYKNKYVYELQRRSEIDYQLIDYGQNFSIALRHKYLLSADGYGAAWKRVPSILFSNSLLFKVQSSKIQYFYDKMIPDVHYIQINNDLSNLFTKMDQMNNNPQKAKRIIRNANQLAKKYLQPNYIQSFIIDTLQNYSNIQKLSLSSYEIQKLKSGEQINKIFCQRYKFQLKICQIFILVQALIAIIILIFQKVKDQYNKKLLKSNITYNQIGVSTSCQQNSLQNF